MNAQWVFHVPTPETMDRHFTGALLQEAKDSTRERACVVDMFRPIALEDNMPMSCRYVRKHHGVDTPVVFI